MARIAVVGAGSWGTALAIQLARQHHEVQLWGRNREAMAELSSARCNAAYLPGVFFPPALQVGGELDEVLAHCHWILLAVPSHGFRDAITAIHNHAPRNTPVCWATKGLDSKEGSLLSEVALQLLGETWPKVLLSGPSFAKEVALSLPTAVILAGIHGIAVKHMQQCFHSDYFRVYTTQDVIGVQIAGAVKNVMAIATGICDGLALGANARAALMTRGLAEITRLGLAMGAHKSTFMGLAGMGDLILTCTDNQSRNRRFGLALAQGKGVEEAIASIGQVVEGYSNGALVWRLAQRLSVDMPIVAAVRALLAGECTAPEAVQQLLAREPRIE